MKYFLFIFLISCSQIEIDDKISLVEVGENFVVLKWKKAKSKDAKISYEVYFSHENNIDSVSKILAYGTKAGPKTSKNHAKISNLTPNSTYYVNVLVTATQSDKSKERTSLSMKYFVTGK